MFLFEPLDLTMFSAFFYYLHRVDLPRVFLPNKDHLSVVAYAKLTEHAEVLQSDNLTIGLHLLI